MLVGSLQTRSPVGHDSDLYQDYLAKVVLLWLNVESGHCNASNNYFMVLTSWSSASQVLRGLDECRLPIEPEMFGEEQCLRRKGHLEKRWESIAYYSSSQLSSQETAEACQYFRPISHIIRSGKPFASKNCCHGLRISVWYYCFLSEQGNFSLFANFILYPVTATRW